VLFFFFPGFFPAAGKTSRTAEGRWPQYNQNGLIVNQKIRERKHGAAAILAA
jgi:hypothetical protein